MIFNFNRKNYVSFIKKRFYYVQKSVTEKKEKNYTSTIFLPKTDFPSHLKPKEVIERDRRISEVARFLNCYTWQREHKRGKEFILHDGPPYANGKPHIGHAINKILKDAIIRSQLIQGNRVNYVPGWDCHGLPIELVATKSNESNLTPIEIREKAKALALSMAENQKEVFKQWGVLADWENQCYYTCDTKYVINQLLIFWKLYEKGFIYYDLKPVYWSPSSRTALAESELIYKNHLSKAITVKFETIQETNLTPIYLLIWTTTPWTLPLNKAVYYSEKIKYSLVKIADLPGLYILASEMIEEFKKKLQKEITEQSRISHDNFKKIKYRHPWFKNEIMNVFESSDLTLTGTGLLHSVPAHGHADFTMALKNNLKVESFVNEKGCYTATLDSELDGLSVLGDGSEAVINKLSSEIILTENYYHNYPYDWRTNEPIIIRASNQWYIDTKQLKTKAIECLNKVEVPLKYFENKLQNRPFWCLSRQRKWGVPIPVFFHKKSNRPLVSKSLIYHLCRLFESHGPDIWWTGSLSELFPNEICNELLVERENIIKGEDIMDIWFDSGITWSYVLNGKKSDVYLEGVDQYTGWFQSSLLISAALENEAPFKKILTHGFAVDKNGKKMSKSLGNIVNPETILKGENALGVDTLRWWVVSHSQQSKVLGSDEVLKESYDRVSKIRLCFRYLLGSLNDVLIKDLESEGELQNFDRYLLHKCYKFYQTAMNSYNTYKIYDVASKILYFVVNNISANYLTCVKDRLYCDKIDSSRRKSCQYTLNSILETLCHSIAPILPHLAEEVYLHHPIYKGKRTLFYNTKVWAPQDWWDNEALEKNYFLINEIKKEILSEKNRSKMTLLIEINNNDFELLKQMQGGKEESLDSELTEIFQVAEVKLKVVSNSPKKITLSSNNYYKCVRCRRYTSLQIDNLCTRCEKVILS